MRENRIDIIRGYAILTIALNHLTVLFYTLGLEGRAIPTLTYFGFSSAAEIFFLISGYMVGMIYLPKPGLRQRLWSRAGKIYLYNVAAFIAALAVAWWFGPPLSTATSAETTLQDPLRQGLLFLLLLQHPDLLGVLWLYVLFMLAAPAAIWLARHSLIAALALSLGLYLTAQLTGLNLPGGSPKDDFLWNFNPLAWQLIFFGGIALGAMRFHEVLFRWLEAQRLRPWSIIALLMISVILHRAGIGQAIPFALLDQERLGLLRILHTVLVITALCSGLVILRAHLARWPFRLVAMCGRQTLNCYVASIPATYALAGVWLAQGGHYGTYLAAAVAILLIMVAVAYASERRRQLHSGRKVIPPRDTRNSGANESSLGLK